MVAQLIDISVDEFVKKVLSGERKLTGLRFPEGSIFGEDYIGEMRDHIESRTPEYRQERLDISDSELIRVVAPELYLPYVVANRAILNGAKLNGAELNGAKLNGAELNGTELNGAELNWAYLNGAELNEAYLYWAKLTRAYLNGTELNGAYLNGADLRGAELNGANLNGANLNGANLNGADLRGVRNLDKVISLGDAIFIDTIVTETEKAIIEPMLRKQFDVRE